MPDIKEDHTKTTRTVTMELGFQDFHRLVMENVKEMPADMNVTLVRLRTLGGSAPSHQWNMLSNFEFQVLLEGSDG